MPSAPCPLTCLLTPHVVSIAFIFPHPALSLSFHLPKTGPHSGSTAHTPAVWLTLAVRPTLWQYGPHSGSTVWGYG